MIFKPIKQINWMEISGLLVGVFFTVAVTVFGLVLYGNADDLQASILVFVVSGNDLRDFHSAGAAP